MVCVRIHADSGKVTAGTSGLCDHCGSPSTQALLKSYIPVPDFTCPRDDELCQDCYNSASGTFRNITYEAWTEANIEGMQFKDWMTVVLTSGVIALVIAREIHEVILCELTRLRLSQKVSSSMLWVCLEHLNAYLRRFLLLPMVLMSAVCLVVARGGDALNVCFNALALVFLLECDNLLYENVLDDHTRALVHDNGWVEVDETVATFLARTKFAHFVGISICIPACVLIAYTITDLDKYPQIIVNALAMYFVFPMTAILETQLRMDVSVWWRCRAMMVVVAKACLGKRLSNIHCILWCRVMYACFR